jgi:hypothetical protein
VTSYLHFRRYGKKPGSADVAAIDVIGDGQVVYRGHRYDLRSGEKGAKHPGFGHHADGRYLQWHQPDGTLEVHHPEGRVAPVQVYGGKHVALVGTHLVFADDISQPWLVIDSMTGGLLGRVEDQRGDATEGDVLYTPQWFDPHNDRTLWLCEGSRLAELDVEKRRMARTIEADPEHVFVAVAALADGHVITLARTHEDKAAGNREGDRIVLFSPSGERLRDVAGEVMFLHRLGDQFIVSDDHKKQFVLLDRSLEPVASVPMYEPGRDGFNAIVPLPSGREWIGVGGRGEWDHYGEPDLAPTGGPPKPRRSSSRPKRKNAGE